MVNLPGEQVTDISLFRDSDAGKKLVGAVLSEFSKAKTARFRTQRQWYENMSMYYNKQDIRYQVQDSANGPIMRAIKQRAGNNPVQSINITRGLVRTEMAKLLSQKPTTTVIPATAEDEDFRMALAAEQVFESYRATKGLLSVMEETAWWMSVTGTGFVKCWWDDMCEDPETGQTGDIKYGTLTPFNVFVPDLLERNIEDQPFVIIATVKPAEWVKRTYGGLLEDPDSISARSTSINDIMDTSYMNLDSSNAKPDSVTIYECWVKPGGLPGMDKGGYVQIIEEQIVQYLDQGLPYAHGQFPIIKLESIPTAKFYADSTLNDTNNLQREYNEIRQRIRDSARKMGSPQLLSEKGAILTSRTTNTIGDIIEYKMGRPAPSPLPLSQLPQYLLDQQDRIKGDLEDVSGQHQVSKGQAPAGLTAGTAITALQERDDQYLQTTFDSLERAYEKIARQTLSNFVQFVDQQRQIKVVGRDGAFDLLELNGADLKNSTDIRVESGSTVPQSKAAKQAYLMDLWQYGIITDPTAILKLLNVGGTQDVLDTMNVSLRQAQRENIKMKKLDPEMLAQGQAQYDQQADMFKQAITANPDADMPDLPDEQSAVPVNDYDEHTVHIDAHNTFRRTQEFEMLPDPIKREFEVHVAAHQKMQQQTAMTSFLSQIPGDGSDGSDSQDAQGSTGQPGEMASTDETQAQDAGGDSSGMTPPGTLAPNGAAPAPQPTSGGPSA